MLKLTEQMEEIVRREVSEHRTYWLLYTMDLCWGFINGELEQADKIADWILENEYEKYLYFNSIAYADIICGRILLLKGEYIRLLGLTESFRRQASIFPNLLAIIYIDIYEAVADEKMLRNSEAETVLSHALEIAMPDGLIMPFVENRRGILTILERLSCESRYTDFIRMIQENDVLYRNSVESIKSTLCEQKKPELTPRERQIGLLASNGLNNREIAESLHISQNTVKAELKRLFVKLNINSRVLLKKDMFQ